MPRGKSKANRRLTKRVRVELEVPRAYRSHVNLSVLAAAQGQRMQQVRRLAEVDASEQREIVSCLQKTKVIENRIHGFLCRREPEIGGNLLQQRLLESLLLHEKPVKQRQLRLVDGRTVSVFCQEIVSVHGDERCCVRILRGNGAHGAIADGKIIGKIDFFERGVFSDELH